MDFYATCGGAATSPEIAETAEAFNHPLLGTGFHPLPGATLPPEMTFLTMSAPQCANNGGEKG